MYNTDLPNRADLPSSKQLLKSTALAAAVAATLLITCILPAEYGIDPTGIGEAIGLKKMGEIKQQLHQEADAEATATPASLQLEQLPEAISARANTPLSVQQHEMRVTLEPNQATEIKLSMPESTVVQYRWVTEGGGLNFDTHGDIVNAPKGFYHGYGKGVNQTEDAGQLTAAFDGKHGWFWRNRGKQAVTVTLTTEGAYEKIERVF